MVAMTPFYVHLLVEAVEIDEDEELREDRPAGQQRQRQREEELPAPPPPPATSTPSLRVLGRSDDMSAWLILMHGIASNQDRMLSMLENIDARLRHLEQMFEERYPTTDQHFKPSEPDHPVASMDGVVHPFIESDEDEELRGDRQAGQRRQRQREELPVPPSLLATSTPLDCVLGKSDDMTALLNFVRGIASNLGHMLSMLEDMNARLRRLEQRFEETHPTTD